MKWELLRGVDRDAGTACRVWRRCACCGRGDGSMVRGARAWVWSMSGARDRISALDVPTPGYNLVNLNLHWRQRTALGASGWSSPH